MIRFTRYGVDIANRVQVIVTWSEWGWPRRWFWPQAGSSWYKLKSRPVFTGYRIGPLDIRVWSERLPVRYSEGG